MKRPLSACAIVIAAAVWILLAAVMPEDYFSVPDGKEITLTGIVTGKEVKENSYSGERESVVYLRLPEKDTTVMAYFSPVYEPEMGKYLKIRGKCKEFPMARNPGEFDMRSYYRIQKISCQLQDAEVLSEGGKADLLKEGIYRLKKQMEKMLDDTLDEEDSGIMKAILLGDKSCLDSEIRDIYKRNGIIHVIAVSGLHISIIGLSLYKFFRKMCVGVLPAAIVSILIMYMYGIMCGMSTSAFRAIAMFAVRLLADVIGRTYDMLSALALSAILILAEQPLYILHSGFLMSFGAVMAIGYILPAIPKKVREGRLKILMGGFSISLMTFPVYTSFYFTFPVYSIILNLFILPLMTVLMFLGLICIGAGTLVLPLGIVLGAGCHIILKWFHLCCMAGDMLPYGTWYVGHSSMVQVVIYLIMIAIFVLLGEDGMLRKKLCEVLKERKNMKKFNPGKMMDFGQIVVLVSGLLVLCLRYHPEMKITAVDVGQGDGIVVESRHSCYMIDGGSTSQKNVGKYRLMPFLSYEGIGSLDAVIITHEDEDHISGILEMLEFMEKRKGSLKIKNLIMPDIDENSKGENYRALIDKAALLGIPVSYIKCGDEINSRNLSIKCIGPLAGMRCEGANAYSTILMIRCGSFSGLFTGDVESVGQDNLKEYIRNNPEEFENLTLLKVAHHGSRYTSDEEFLGMIRPRISLISCGIDNRYGHPHAELLDRLKNIDTSVFRTDQSGAVTVTYNRGHLFIGTFLKP